RRASTLVSLLSAALLAAVAASSLRRTRASAAPAAGAAPTLGSRSWALLLATTAGYLALKTAVIDRHGLGFWTRRFDGTSLSGARISTSVDFGGELLLLGADLADAPVASGNTLPVRLYWRALGRMGAEYSTSLVLVDGEGHVWGQQDSLHPGGYPTTRWETDAYVADDHPLLVLPGTPPGRYILKVGAYDPRSGHQLDVIDERGAPAGTVAPIGEVEVVRPATPPDVSSLGMARTIQAPLSADLELLGASLPDVPLSPGARVTVTLFWRALRRPATDYQTLVSLGRPPAPDSRQAAWATGGSSYPTTTWEPGEIVRAQHDLLIPGDAPAGELPLWIALRPAAGAAGPAVEVGRVQVLAIKRRWDVPPMEVALGARFGPIRLLGYDLGRREVRRGEALHLRLYWQAVGPISEEYTVFTHLLGPQEHMSAQKDSVPVSGTRPTTSWAKGEVIVDDYDLVVRDDAPAGTHCLEIGLYEPQSGRRLPLLDAAGREQGDNIRVDAITVLP
ncbi:MAG: hypothetical protein K6V36_12365, partial [Anaerolineae bacterium]|nr:hypothetical protein [Anaerolineae bacterium]